MKMPGIDLEKLIEKQLEEKNKKEDEFKSMSLQLLTEHVEYMDEIVKELEKMNAKLERVSLNLSNLDKYD